MSLLALKLAYEHDSRIQQAINALRNKQAVTTGVLVIHNLFKGSVVDTDYFIQKMIKFELATLETNTLRWIYYPRDLYRYCTSDEELITIKEYRKNVVLKFKAPSEKQVATFLQKIKSAKVQLSKELNVSINAITITVQY